MQTKACRTCGESKSMSEFYQKGAVSFDDCRSCYGLKQRVKQRSKIDFNVNHSLSAESAYLQQSGVHPLG